MHACVCVCVCVRACVCVCVQPYLCGHSACVRRQQRVTAYPVRCGLLDVQAASAQQAARRGSTTRPATLHGGQVGVAWDGSLETVWR